MNRSSLIVDLALNSKIINPSRETEQHLLSVGSENIAICTRDLDITENYSFPSTSRCVSDSMGIKSGNDLIQFKENLRPRISSYLNPKYAESKSSREQEPFSAEEPSEYVPSAEEKSIVSNESEEIGQIIIL